MLHKPVLLLAAAAFVAPGADLTACQVIDEIKRHVGVPWNEKTVDTFKAGDPDTPVTGIATTMMATFDVLRRASAEGRNLVITHEPTFYGHLDGTSAFEQERDEVWAEKDKFIREHKMVIWRFHDHWHLHKPDGIVFGVLRSLGWQKQFNADTGVITIPQTTLAELAAYVEKKLGSKVLRAIGDQRMKVTSIAFWPGASGFARHRPTLQRKDVEVLLIGEVPEWETIEYVADAAAQGRKKALLLLGHIPSEQPGMEYCAEWLRTFIRNTPVSFVPATEPFWTPK